jgi:hypothetical protein
MSVWRIEDHTNTGKGFLRVVDSDGFWVCDIFPFGGIKGSGAHLERDKSNAVLIAAAPDLRDTLQAIIDQADALSRDEVVAFAKAAVQRATRSTP